MTASQSVLFRFDAGLELGGGHAMRCLGLASALRERGMATLYAVRQSTLDTLPSLSQDTAEILTLDQGRDVDEGFLGGRVACDWFVADHPDWQTANSIRARTVSSHVAVISDSPDRAFDCDMMLDTTSGREAQEYDGLVPTGCKVLTGPRYALLRPDFAALRHGSIRDKKKFKAQPKILIGFGATDPHSATIVALDAVERAAPGAQVDIILGSLAPCLDEIRTRAATGSVDITVHVDTPDVAGLMARADFAIGAAGITSWERCSLGLPTIVITQAENQLPNAEALENDGAAEVVGSNEHVSVSDIAQAIGHMLTEPDRRHRMVDAAAVMCDGLGARRFAQVLFPEFARDGVPVTIRPATSADTDTLFAWQCQPETRKYFRTPDAPSRDTHERWLTAKLADPGCVFGIVEHGDAPAGVLRLDITEETASAEICENSSANETYEVSILVAPDRWKRGIGAAALRLARQLMPFAILNAAVDTENTASNRLFKEAGYRWNGAMYVLGGDTATVS